MGTRGRKSTAEMAVIHGIPQRPKPPGDLTPDQATEWRAIVSRMPTGWFPREIWPLLAQYCRHITNSRHIAGMIEDYFHRDAENFIWDMHDPVDDGRIGYVRYVFSYDSKLADSRGKRAVFEGVSICRLRDGLIEDYREVADSVAGLQQLGFGNERLVKLIDREAQALRARPESAHHIKP